VTSITVHPQGGPLVGSVPVPSDKSIGHRALLFASLCEGKSKIRGFSYGEDNVSTANAMRAMGVIVEDVDKKEGELHVTGKGLFGLAAPKVDSINTFDNPKAVAPRAVTAAIKKGRLTLTVPPASVTVVTTQ